MKAQRKIESQGRRHPEGQKEGKPEPKSQSQSSQNQESQSYKYPSLRGPSAQNGPNSTRAKTPGQTDEPSEPIEIKEISAAALKRIRRRGEQIYIIYLKPSQETENRILAYIQADRPKSGGPKPAVRDNLNRIKKGHLLGGKPIPTKGIY